MIFFQIQSRPTKPPDQRAGGFLLENFFESAIIFLEEVFLKPEKYFFGGAMSQQKNSDERCCQNPRIEKVTEGLDGKVELGTTCTNCGKVISNSAND